MIFKETKLQDVYTVDLDVKSDSRGYFERLFCKEVFQKINFINEIVQINHTSTKNKGTVRGLHFQYPPFAETKIINCIKGKVLDYIVDIRNGSETFLQHICVELSEQNKKMLYVPEGYAHGFQTLEDNTEMLYLHTNFYSKEHEGGLNFLDPLLNIKLQFPISEISERDKKHPFINSSFKGITV